jgi:hypothetical protein
MQGLLLHQIYLFLMLYIFQNPQDKSVLLTHHNTIISQKQDTSIIC